MTKNITVCLLIFTAFASLILFWLMTAQGIGLYADSVAYLSTARHLSAGKGLVQVSFFHSSLKPMTHFPPMYPALLAGISSGFGLDPLSAARWLGAAFFGINVLAAGAVLRALGPRSIWLPVIGSFLVLTSVDMLHVHAVLWTEPLFIFFMLASMALLVIYLRTGGLWILATSAVMVSAALLTRYAGVALVATGAAAIVLLGRQSLSTRGKHAVFFVFVSSLPSALWSMQNLRVAGTATNRRIALHPISVDCLRQGLDSVSAWLLPSTIPLPMRASVLVLAMAGTLTFIVWASRHRQKRSGVRSEPSIAKTTQLVFALLAGIYVVFLFVSISFFDERTPLNFRILAPLWIAMVIFVLLAGYQAWQTLERSLILRRACTGVLLVFIVFSLVRGLTFVNKIRSTGVRYDGIVWKQSEIVRAVISSPAKSLVYTNTPEAFYLIGNRVVHSLPNARGARFAANIALMKQALEENNGTLVYMRLVEWPELPTENDLRNRLPLEVVMETNDGAIYKIRQ